jgi:MoxR-like ATPase
MFKLLASYPSMAEEAEILRHYAEGRDPRQLAGFDLRAVMPIAETLDVQQTVARVIVEKKVTEYIAQIVSKTREWPTLAYGASPRGSVNLCLAARTLAACRGRDFTTPSDVKEVAPWVLRHRIRLRGEAEIEGGSADQVVRQILETVPVPRT